MARIDSKTEAGGGGGSVGGLYGLNVESITGAKNLTVGVDKIYQFLSPSGNGFDINMLTAGANISDRWVIKNTGSYDWSRGLDIESNGTKIDDIFPGTVRFYIFDGTNWVGCENGASLDLSHANLHANIAIGYLSKAYGVGVGVGYKAYAQTKGTALGADSTGYSYGVGIGYDAEGNDYSVAIGAESKTNNKRYSAAIGYRSECERVGELAMSIGSTSDQENNMMIAGWEGQTADATPIEIYCAGYGTERFTIRASSALTFKIMVTARDNTSGDCAAYIFDGLIKRDAADNTTMSVCNKTVTHEDDATWDCNVTADDVNEALIITVTGDAVNTTQWAARLDGVETHF